MQVPLLKMLSVPLTTSFFYKRNAFQDDTERTTFELPLSVIETTSFTRLIGLRNNDLLFRSAAGSESKNFEGSCQPGPCAAPPTAQHPSRTRSGPRSIPKRSLPGPSSQDRSRPRSRSDPFPAPTRALNPNPPGKGASLDSGPDPCQEPNPAQQGPGRPGPGPDPERSDRP